MSPGLISGITRGTFGSIRKAEELSTTTAPAAAAMGANFLLIEPLAENSARSTPEGRFPSFPDRVVRAGKLDRFAFGPRGGQHDDILHRHALLEDRDEVLPDRPGRTHNGYA